MIILAKIKFNHFVHVTKETLYIKQSKISSITYSYVQHHSYVDKTSTFRTIPDAMLIQAVSAVVVCIQCYYCTALLVF